MTTKTTKRTKTIDNDKRARTRDAMDNIAKLAAKMVADMPGLNGGEYRQLIGAKIGSVGRALRAAERRGLVSKTWVEDNASHGGYWRWAPSNGGAK